MLSDHDSELLTAFLDGEASVRQRKAALRLLRRSPEARALLQQMQENARRLRDLSPHKAPAGLPLRVLRAIAERGLCAGGAGTPAAARPLPAWVGLALAASVLLAVTGSSFLFFRATLPGPEALALHGQGAYQWPSLPELPRDNPVVNSILAGAINQYVDPGTHLALTQLAEEPARAALTRTLRQDVAYHLDLRTDAPAQQTVARLETAFKDSGVRMLIDARAGAGLKKRQPKTRYLIYAENLRPDEVSGLLQRLAREVKGTPEKVVLNPLSDDDRTQLSQLMGLPAGTLTPARRLEPHEMVPPLREPIRDPKADVGQQPKTKTPQQPERFAVVLADDGPTMSAQVRDFLAARQAQPARPGTLQVCFVVHETSA